MKIDSGSRLCGLGCSSFSMVIDCPGTVDFLFIITITAAIAATTMPPMYRSNELSIPPSSEIGCVGWAEANVLMYN